MIHQELSQLYWHYHLNRYKTLHLLHSSSPSTAGGTVPWYPLKWTIGQSFKHITIIISDSFHTQDKFVVKYNSSHKVIDEPFIRLATNGREPWSSGYGRRLTILRSWVRILVPYIGWTFFHIKLL